MDIKLSYSESNHSVTNAFEVRVELKVDSNDEIYPQLLALSEDYSQVRVMDSAEDYENYLEGLTFGVVFEDRKDDPQDDLIPVEVTSSYEKSPVLKTSRNDSQILYFDSDSDSFVFDEYIEKNEATVAMLEMLKDIERGVEPNSYTHPDWHVLRIIRCLDTFWF